MGSAGVSLVAAVATWAGGGASRERLAIFIGLWVPSLLLVGAYLTRKADDEAAREEFPEEPSYWDSL